VRVPAAKKGGAPAVSATPTTDALAQSLATTASAKKVPAKRVAAKKSAAKNAVAKKAAAKKAA
jgi:hypothetical protein